MLTAIDHVNATGGVNGAMFEPVVCVSDATPDGTINCANELVEQGVDLVTYGAVINMDAALPIFEGADIAIISDFAFNQTPSDHVWALTSPGGSFNLYSQMALQELGSKKPGFLPIEAPVFHYHADIWPKWGAELGLDSVVGPFADPGNADWTSAVQTVLSEGADSLAYFGPTNGAIAIEAAARQLGFEGPIITTDSTYANELDGSQLTNNYILFPRFPGPAAAAAAPPRIQENTDEYVEAMTAAGQEDLIVGNAEQAFTAVMDIRTILETIPEGPINYESIKATLDQDREMIGFDAPDFNCGKPTWPESPSFCRSYQQVLKFSKDGDELTMTPIKEENGGFYYDLDLAARSTSL